MARWIIRLKENKEYLGTLSCSIDDLFFNIDELCDPFAVEIAKEFSFRSYHKSKWLEYDRTAPYTGFNGTIIECKHT
jgi:hypothetical protein